MKYLHILLFLILFVNNSYGQKKDSINSNESNFFSTLADKTLNLLTYEKKSYSMIMMPVFGYDEQNGIQLGILPTWYLHSKNKKQKDSKIATQAEFSTKGLYLFELETEIFTRNDWIIKGIWQYRFLPDRFYNLGNNSDKENFSFLNSKKLELIGSISRKIYKKIYAGLNYDITKLKNENISDKNILNKNILGQKGGFVSGVGLSLTYENRDNIVYSTKGEYIKFEFTKYTKLFGDYDFNKYEIDIRKFFKLSKINQTIALQAYMCSTPSNNVPYFKLPKFSGKKLFRGIPYPYKYIDKHTAYIQASFRTPVISRFGLELFSGVGNVSDKPKNLFKNAQAMAGIGLKILLLPSEKLNCRLDYGITSKNEHGIFFTIGEAF